MAEEISQAKEKLIQELGRLSSFAGFNKAMGQIYALLYLSPEPVSLGEIAEQLGISKGNASLNVKTMERWGLIQPISKNGDRRDYYQAETDFWKIVQDILNERDRKEIDHALKTLDDIYSLVKSTKNSEKNAQTRFYQERLSNMLDFGNAASQMVKAMLNMNNLRQQSSGRIKTEKKASQHINIEEG
jgi:HTH-type transcriptional regulator, glycine betaine synthesis regulator